MALSARFEGAYDQLLELLGVQHDQLPDLVCCHWPTYQESYTGQLMVVGQALNGWVVEAAPADWLEPAARQTTLREARRYGESPKAFSWMSPTVRSRPFWRLVRLALVHLSLSVEQIVWSNLAKVAPAAGRNPTKGLVWKQHRLGGGVLRHEVAELSPRLVLVVSGRGYAEPFLTNAGLSPQWSRSGALQFAGQPDGRDWIVVNHPGTFADRYNESAEALRMALQARR